MEPGLPGWLGALAEGSLGGVPAGAGAKAIRQLREPYGHHSDHNGGIVRSPMQFLRSTLLPAAIVLLFGLALFAVSARIWLPSDMAAPAPIG